MKKSLLALAVLSAFAGAASAQSSVTLSGGIDVAVQRTNGAWNMSTGNSGRSNFTLSGTEDLGGGMKAGFQIEHGFDPSTGTAGTPFWGRQAEVNLSGGFGTVRLGTFISEAYFATSDYIGMHNHETGDSADAFYTYLGRNANKVGYMSPNLGGLVLHASMSVAEGTDTDRTYDLAANYDAGPLHLGAGYEKNGDATQFALRGLYELGAITLGAYVQRSDLPLAGDAVSGRVSVMYALGASEFHLNVGRGGEYANVRRSDAVQYTLGYNYNLSKRTKVYGYYTRIDRDDVVKFYGGNYDAWALGIRHNF